MEQIAELLECAVCLDRFKEPKVLPCQHTFCLRPCLQNIVINNSVRCPECRACHILPPNGVEGLPTNLMAVKFLDRSYHQKPNRQCKEREFASQPTSDGVPPTAERQQPSHALRNQTVVSSIPQLRDSRSPRVAPTAASRVADALQRYRNKGRVIKYFGTEGNDVGQMDHPSGICSTASDDIVVADSFNHRIQVLDVNGRVRGIIGSKGEGEGQFHRVFDVCVTSRGRIVASDWYNNRIQIFDEHGRLVRTSGGEGSGDGEFNGSCGVTTDDKGLIYVCDMGNPRVQVFTEEGKFVRSLGRPNLREPTYLSVTSNGRVVVSDVGVHVFDSNNGRPLLQFGSEGTGEGQFICPQGVALDDHGNMIVCDMGNDRVQIFTSSGEFVTCFGSYGSDPGQMLRPTGVCLLSDGRIAVTDSGNNRVQIF